MTLPDPEPGLVISYAYLWRREFDAGRDAGQKTRPCVIILAVEKRDHVFDVTVAPITHSPPTDQTIAVEIPARVKEHLGLDAFPS